jgi:phospholipid/cholesterol/gamma-HCH transport system permease protein
MREEIDALRHGLRSVQVLILPRVIALVSRLAAAHVPGLDGGALRQRPGWLVRRHEPGDLHCALARGDLRHPFQGRHDQGAVLALAIGVVACSERAAGQGQRPSFGLQTTTSVVKSIFLVIVLDGLFAIFFASIGM